jgi:hypothetical protein
MFAGAMSRWITPRRCIPATGRANPSPRPASLSTGSGLVMPARLASQASSSTTDPGYRGASASHATPATPNRRSSIATSCRTWRSASGPSGSLRMTVRPGRNSLVMRVRSLECTISARRNGSGLGRTPASACFHRAPLHTRPGLPYLPTPRLRACTTAVRHKDCLLFRTSRGCEYLDLTLPHPGVGRGQLAVARVAA